MEARSTGFTEYPDSIEVKSYTGDGKKWIDIQPGEHAVLGASYDGRSYLLILDDQRNVIKALSMEIIQGVKSK